ncbi:hypothetical protein L2E82_18333 [Cichorium intybus]|uniref:Uncharacterized protein n=1 Tax=Cichorium intybus TaxID=13427 RepID=A0ACB9F9B8_CICIN|nr:hypothetical protein L2E82_18333 [Cichorium intybus]
MFLFVVDEVGGVEIQESRRLRDRGVAKEDRGNRERERGWSSQRNKRTKNRMMIRKRCLKQDSFQRSKVIPDHEMILYESSILERNPLTPSRTGVAGLVKKLIKLEKFHRK